jgi:hypothetical protein
MSIARVHLVFTRNLVSGKSSAFFSRLHYHMPVCVSVCVVFRVQDWKLKQMQQARMGPSIG